MHAVIENTLHGCSINVPADFIPLMQIARLSDPYKVQYFDYKFFKNFSSIPNLKSIQLGRETVNYQ